MSQAVAVPPLVELLSFLVSQVVSDPESIQISRMETPKTDLFYLKVNQDDLGRLLGREGKTVESIRTMLEVAAAQYGKGAIVDVIEPKHGKADDRPKRSRRRGKGKRGKKSQPGKAKQSAKAKGDKSGQKADNKLQQGDNKPKKSGRGRSRNRNRNRNRNRSSNKANKPNSSEKSS